VLTTWKRPDLPAGPLRDLSDALHELRERSGLSSRQIATALQRRHGDAPSHTTVHQLFTQPKLQPAELVLRVAEILLAAQSTRTSETGDQVLDRIDQLWRLAAGHERAEPVPPIRQDFAATPEAPAWRPVAAPSSTPNSEFFDVVATDPTHALAVGCRYLSTGGHASTAPIVDQWDGARWSPVRLPERSWPGGLRLVAAESRDEVWAVGRGYVDAAMHETVTYVLHHDGDGWFEVPFPAGNVAGQLSITGLAAVDGHVWLIGRRSLEVAVHEYDGQTWREHDLPMQCRPAGFHSGVPTYCYFTAIVAFTKTDVWACGHGTWPGFKGPLLLHWDGGYWETIDVGRNQSGILFNAIAGRSSGDLWLVGNTPIPGDASVPPASLVVHRDGNSWRVVDGLPVVRLADVACDAAGRPWLIHNAPEPTSTFATYDAGSGSWHHVFAPGPPGAREVDLHRIAAVPGAATMFAVGAAMIPSAPHPRHAVILERVPLGACA